MNLVRRTWQWSQPPRATKHRVLDDVTIAILAALLAHAYDGLVAWFMGGLAVFSAMGAFLGAVVVIGDHFFLERDDA